MKFPAVIILLFLASDAVFPQHMLNYRNSSVTGDPDIDHIAFIVAPSPVLLIENRKVYFGLSKEVSLGFGKYAEHRVAFEYTYVFRDSVRDHFRLSYNLDFFPGSILNFTGGIGYYTDNKKKGIFPQLSFGALGTGGHFYFSFYLKSRVTFMFKKAESGIFDLSLGIGIGLAPFGAKVRKGFGH